jgi:hypothetical protein
MNRYRLCDPSFQTPCQSTMTDIAHVKDAMPSTPPSHTGILREETLVLGQIFGYDGQPTARSPTLPPTGIPLPGSRIKDVLLVSVDVDPGGRYEVVSPDQSFHVGVSIFDTRCLNNYSPTDPQDAIASYQFISRCSQPTQRAVKQFLLGPTETLSLTAMAARLLDLTKGRDYILVAHGIGTDLKFLNNTDPAIVAGACYVLDTVKAAQFTLQLYSRYSLELQETARTMHSSRCS